MNGLEEKENDEQMWNLIGEGFLSSLFSEFHEGLEFYCLYFSRSRKEKERIEEILRYISQRMVLCGRE